MVVGTSVGAGAGASRRENRRVRSVAVHAVPGVEAVAVDLATGTVTVTAARPVDRADIAAAVDEAGYALVP